MPKDCQMNKGDSNTWENFILRQAYSKTLGSLIELIRKSTNRLSPKFLAAKHPDFKSPITGIKTIPVIGFLGGFSVGKSTTVNAILQGTLDDPQCVGQDDVSEVKKILANPLSPVDVLPTTVCGLLFRYGASFQASLYRDKERSFLSEAKIVTNIQEYLNIIQDRHHLVTIAFIEIQLPHPFLQKYCEILDMPGHNSVLAEDKQRLFDMIEKCDGLIYLFSQRGLSQDDREFILSLLQTVKQIQENQSERIVRDHFHGPISFWMNFNEMGEGNPKEAYTFNEQKLHKLSHSLSPYFIRRIFGGQAPVHCFDSFDSLHVEMQHFYEYLIYFSQVAILSHLDQCREESYAQTYNVDERLRALFQGRRAFSLLESVTPGRYSQYFRPLMILYYLRKISKRIQSGEQLTPQQIYQLLDQEINPRQSSLRLQQSFLEEEAKAGIHNKCQPNNSQDIFPSVRVSSRAWLLGSVLYELSRLSHEQAVLQKMEAIYPDFEKNLFGKPTYLTFGNQQLCPILLTPRLKEIEESFQIDSHAIAQARKKQSDNGRLERGLHKFKPLSEQEKLERRISSLKRCLSKTLQLMERLHQKYTSSYLFKHITPHFCKEAIDQIAKNQYLLPICGTFSSGKSTFLNALLDNQQNPMSERMDILPVDDTPTTAFITELHFAKKPYAQLDWWCGPRKIPILQWSHHPAAGRNKQSTSLRICHEEISYLQQLLAELSQREGLPQLQSCQISRLKHPDLQDYDARKIITQLPQNQYSTGYYEFPSSIAQEDADRKVMEKLQKDIPWDDPILEIYLTFTETKPLKLPLESKEQIEQWQKYQKTCYSFLICKAHIFWNLPMLNDICLVDTPGFHSTIATHDKITEDYLDHCSTCIFLLSGAQPLTQDEADILEKLCHRFSARKTEGHHIPPIFIVITKVDLLERKQVIHRPRPFVEEQLSKKFPQMKDHILVREISVFQHRSGKDNRVGELIQEVSLELCKSPDYQRIEESRCGIQEILEAEVQNAQEQWRIAVQQSYQYQKFQYQEKTEVLYGHQKEQENLKSNLEKNQVQSHQAELAYHNLQNSLNELTECIDRMLQDELEYIENFSSKEDFQIFNEGSISAPSWWQFWKSKQKRSGTSWSSRVTDIEQELKKKIDSISQRYERRIKACFLPSLPNIDASIIRYEIQTILDVCYERSGWSLWLVKKFNVAQGISQLRDKLRDFFRKYQAQIKQWIATSNNIIAKISYELQQQYATQAAQLHQQIEHVEYEIKRWQEETAQARERQKQNFDRKKAECEQRLALLKNILDELKEIKKNLDV